MEITGTGVHEVERTVTTSFQEFLTQLVFVKKKLSCYENFKKFPTTDYNHMVIMFIKHEECQ
jgi:hypothetical protein